MVQDKYIIVRITKDEDDYITITTWKKPVVGLAQAKIHLRLIARTESNVWPETGEDRFEDFYNPEGTAWGPIPGDKKETRYVIVKLDYGFYTKVIS